jgi:Protein of unknown function, DUF547
MIIPVLAFAQTEIYDNWDKLTTKYVKQSNRENIQFNSVDYSALRSDNTFPEIIDLLQDFDISKLKTRNQKLTFWINVYNIAAIKVVFENDIPNSIKDAGNLFKPVWKNDAINIGGKTYSLGEIEHEILREMDQPLIHFGIVCASLSCPDIRIEAYRPETVIEQLEDNTRLFLMNETKGMKLDQSKKEVVLSPIFKWFKADFNNGIPQFIKQYSGIDTSTYKIKYLDYNWNLNKP